MRRLLTAGAVLLLLAGCAIWPGGGAGTREFRVTHQVMYWATVAGPGWDISYTYTAASGEWTHVTGRNTGPVTVHGEKITYPDIREVEMVVTATVASPELVATQQGLPAITCVIRVDNVVVAKVTSMAPRCSARLTGVLPTAESPGPTAPGGSAAPRVSPSAGGR